MNTKSVYCVRQVHRPATPVARISRPPPVLLKASMQFVAPTRIAARVRPQHVSNRLPRSRGLRLRQDEEGRSPPGRIREEGDVSDLHEPCLAPLVRRQREGCRPEATHVVELGARACSSWRFPSPPAGARVARTGSRERRRSTRAPLALTEFVARRDTDRAIHMDNRRQTRASAERKAASTIRQCPDYAVGTWFILHKRAFGPQFQNHLNKLESKEEIGPFRIIELCEHGRIRVDLEQQFTKHKSDVFSLEDVNKFLQRRPRAESVIGVGEHNADWDETTEFEVEAVERRWIRGEYRYKVIFKGYDGAKSHGWKPMDAPEFRNCQRLIDQYDATHPYGSLRRDHVPHKREFERKRRSLRHSPRIEAARFANAVEPDSLKDQLVEHRRKVNSLVSVDRGCSKFVDSRTEVDAPVIECQKPT
eukprot:SAG11_NODE_1803_length_4235_cov_6.769342_1_plen_420_part_00